MRLTVIGCGPAAPQADTPASGLLVESGPTAILLDCGYGVVGRLRAVADPLGLTGVIIGHLHADHALDLAALRYLHPWPGLPAGRPTVWLPPGGRAHLTALAGVMSERASFFDDAFDVREYQDGQPFRLGGLAITPHATQHYVPAFAMSVRDPDGTQIVYCGDSGPTDRLVEIGRDADLLIEEATLASAAEDEPRRGHSTAGEAIAIAVRADAARLLLTHFPSARRPDLVAIAARTAAIPVEVAHPGLRLEVARQAGVRAPLADPGASSRATRSRMGAAPGSSPSSTSAVRQ
ncbi:MAG TPA: MBL fold metallo-hydrolase [Candidatus Limnocylindrales bacterium]